MTYTKYLKATSALLTASFLGGVLLSSTVQAADGVLEEIVVTAQQREQSLRDVPISVSVVSGAEISEGKIQRMADLQFSVPSFTMAESGIGTNVFMRGIGSGNNQGFEQSVGIYIDGVHHGRAQQSRQPFLDLARVEVLRGPQSILFGKNSVAGALNITTARPTEEFEGSVSLSYEPTDNEKEATLVLSGPLSDNVRVRLAARYHDLGGWIENITLGQDEPQQEDWAIRGTVEWDVSDDFMVRLKVEKSEYDVVGRNIETSDEVAAAAGPFTGFLYSQILAGLYGQDASVGNNVLDGKRHANGDFSNNEQTEIVLTLEKEFGEHVLTSVSGYSDFKFNDNCDCDFVGADVFTLPLSEAYEQFSQEIRLTSPIGETFDYILGAYFQTSKHDYSDALEVSPNSVLVPLLNANPAFATIPFPVGTSMFANTSAPRTAHVDADVYSAFAQVSWHISEDLTLQLGGRLTHEKKEGTKDLKIAQIDGSPLEGLQMLAPNFYGLAFGIAASNALDAATIADITGSAALGAGLGTDTHPLLTALLGTHGVTGSRSETRFSPEIKLQYDASDDAMVYASYTRGSKSGGFDFRSNNKGTFATMEDAFEFEDETASNFEVGGKFVLADGSAEINFAGYFTKFSDLQVSVFDGALGFNVGNAAKAEVWGAEIDGRWQLSDEFMLTGALAYTDFKFKEYPNGRCNFGETPTSVVNGVDQCDYSGRTNQLVSDWQGNVGLDHNMPLGNGLELHSNVNMFFTSAYEASPSNDPVLRQDGYAKINARVAIGDPDAGWEFAILGENLTDKRVRLFAADAPLSGSTFGAISKYNFVSRGRTVTFQARMNF